MGGREKEREIEEQREKEMPKWGRRETKIQSAASSEEDQMQRA